MSFKRNPHHSIISSSESQPSCVNASNHRRNFNKPLINSAVTSSNMSDEEIARQEQERLQFESLMDVDPPTGATAAASFDPKLLEAIDNDAAIALHLQEQEYSRNSLLPSWRESNSRPSSSTVTQSYPDPTVTDAQLAAQLQAEEDKKRQRQRQRPVVAPSQQRRRPSHNDQPEIIPFPFAHNSAHDQRPSSSGNINGPTGDMGSLFRIFANHAQRSPGARRPGRHGAHNLENTTEDFGPNDYENLLELDKSVVNKPLTTDEIERLPIEKFQRRATKNDEDNKCNICWDEFEQNQPLRRLRCLHLYHKDCIDPWLKTNSSCPICRLSTK